MITQDILTNIWDGCLNYDRKQEELLYKRFAPRMMAVCTRYARSRDEAQDILQDGFIKVFKNRNMYRGEGSLEGWIRRIMVHTALSLHRKNKGLVFCDVTSDTNTFSQTYQNDSLEAAELLKLINQLPGNYRNVFNMYAIEGYSHQEIGSSLGISEVMARTTLHRARAILKTRLIKLDASKMYRAIA